MICIPFKHNIFNTQAGVLSLQIFESQVPSVKKIRLEFKKCYQGSLNKVSLSRISW